MMVLQDGISGENAFYLAVLTLVVKEVVVVVMARMKHKQDMEKAKFDADQQRLLREEQARNTAITRAGLEVTKGMIANIATPGTGGNSKEDANARRRRIIRDAERQFDDLLPQFIQEESDKLKEPGPIPAGEPTGSGRTDPGGGTSNKTDGGGNDSRSHNPA